ncbi:MAG TPA: UDP-N-acetylmuramoyl-L-alanine--D-glutamate ligase [Acidimicrobiales bacterium]|nr:UDP-N-acetylmuramoyl-L-alanine--D-glutamate ligase [Acidimicrobiales bacterium]
MADERFLVVGLGVAAESMVRQARRRGHDVVVLEDRPSDVSRERAARLGVEMVTDVDVATLVAAVDAVLPSPGVAIGHSAIQTALASGVPVWTEFELAAQWDSRPLVAITGTNGKTTVTTLVEEMLRSSGRRVVACGNNDLPLIEAIADPDIELFVVEASSFRLEFTETFRPIVGTWLNFSPDHLDWHPDLTHYADAKSKIWRSQCPDDLAIGNVDDVEVMRHLRRAPSRQQTFGLTGGDYRVSDDMLVTPDGGEIAAVADLPRNLPHDVANSLAAAATAIGAGAAVETCGAVLRSFAGLPHRVALVRDAGGVRWYDDSKATTPASVVTAVSGFDSVVLIAGGKNKGLDLGVLRDVAPRIKHVVAIGEATTIVEDVFRGVVPTQAANSMDEAVALAAGVAGPGDVVLLSPGCASYDWYRNYGERGDDFARAVNELEVG